MEEGGKRDEEGKATVPLLGSNHPNVTPILGCITFVAACGAFSYGCIITYSAPTQSGIIADLNLSVAEFSFFGSILTIGGLVGAIVSGKVTDLIGRKYMTCILGIIYIIGWLFVAFAKDAWLLDLGRLVLGFGTGIGGYLVPVYFSEAAPKNLRGRLLALVLLMTACGICFVFVFGTIVNWRTVALIGIIPSLLQIFMLYFVPESPRWLAKIGREKECEEALMRLRGANADIVEETVEIKESIDTLQHISKDGVSDLFQRKYSYMLIVGIGLVVLQQFGGLNAYIFYTDAIFVSAGVSSFIGFISVAAFKIVLSTLSVFLVDNCGRRPILLVSLAGTFMGSFLTGLAFFMQDIGCWKQGTPILALISTMVFMGGFGLGMGGIPWMIISEILPINVKGAAGSLCNVVGYICSWLVSYSFNFMLQWSSAGTFFMFASMNALGIMFVAKLVPETKGRTLEEIQASITH